MTFKGPSGRSYRFGQSTSHQLQWVLAGDLEHFARNAQFEVLLDRLIDPAERTLRQQREAIKRDVLRELGDRLPSPKAQRTSGGSQGRPKGKGFGALLDCLMTCGALAEYFGGVEEAYDEIERRVEAAPDRYPAAVPRQRFAHVRSAARATQRRTGQCPWFGHPEAIPKELAL